MITRTVAERQAITIRAQRKKIRVAYTVAAVLLIALLAASVYGLRRFDRDQQTISGLTTANQKLKIENDQLHRVNDEIGGERADCIKWLEDIQPGINFDGI